MPSFAEQFHLEEDDLRQRAVSLAAYAQSTHLFAFPLADVDPAQRTVFPSPLPEDVLQAEAATAMLGAASAAMVVDQQIGLALTAASADLYWRAGHFYAAFLWAALGLRDQRIFAAAGSIAEQGLRSASQYPAALVPQQLAYLALGVALAPDSETRVANRLFSLIPQTTVVGPYGLPVSLVRDAVAGRPDDQGSVRESAQFLVSSFNSNQQALEFQSRYRRFLPWNAGLSPDAVLMLAGFFRRGALAPRDLATRGPYDTALVAAASSAVDVLREFRPRHDMSAVEVLSAW